MTSHVIFGKREGSFGQALTGLLSVVNLIWDTEGTVLRKTHVPKAQNLCTIFSLLPKRNFPLKASLSQAFSKGDSRSERSTGRSNPLTNFVLLATLCPISALSAILCCVSTAAIERECFRLSAKLCRFWRPSYAESDRSFLFFVDMLNALCKGLYLLAYASPQIIW